MYTHYTVWAQRGAKHSAYGITKDRVRYLWKHVTCISSSSFRAAGSREFNLSVCPKELSYTKALGYDKFTLTISKIR